MSEYKKYPFVFLKKKTYEIAAEMQYPSATNGSDFYTFI